MFADNTNLTAAGQSIVDVENALNSDLENLREWSIAARLSLNVTKTEFMIIGLKPMVERISNSKPIIFTLKLKN